MHVTNQWKSRMDWIWLNHHFSISMILISHPGILHMQTMNATNQCKFINYIDFDCICNIPCLLHAPPWNVSIPSLGPRWSLPPCVSLSFNHWLVILQLHLGSNPSVCFLQPHLASVWISTCIRNAHPADQSLNLNQIYRFKCSWVYARFLGKGALLRQRDRVWMCLVPHS